MMLKSFLKVIALAALLSPAGLVASSLTPVEGRMPAPPIDAPDLSGELRSLSSFSGKVMVINFWATWCPPCIKELPSMQSLWERFRDRDFVMLAINVGDDRQTVEDFLDSFDTAIDFPVLLDEMVSVVKRWPVFGMPTSFVVDADGMVVYKALGERDWNEKGIVAEIEAMIEAGGRRGNAAGHERSTSQPAGFAKG